MAFDVIIIGTGAAGAVLAERLSDGGVKSVLVLESGRDFSTRPYDGITSADPVKQRKIAWRANITQTANDDEHFDYLDQSGRNHLYAKMVGGSTAHNGMQAFTSSQAMWELFPTGWKFADMLPHFNTIISALTIAPRDRITMNEADLALEQSAANLLTIPIIENFNAEYASNASFSSGIGPTTANIKDMVGNFGTGGGMPDKYKGRNSVLENYLEVALPRSNVTLRSESHVKFINTTDLGGGNFTADSVTYTDADGVDQTEVANDLVVCCAGVIGSAALLLRSNIGPSALTGSGNDHAVMSQVGVDYWNQPVALVGAIFNKEIHSQFGYPIPITINRHYDVVNQTTWFGGNLNSGADPSILAADPTWGADWRENARKWRYMQFAFASLVHSVTRGTITIDAQGDPVVDYVDDSTDVTALGVASAEMKAIYDNINNLGGDLQVTSSWIVGGVSISSHGVNTCRIGTNDTNSVVNETTGLVHNFNNLSVVDASLIPTQIQSPHMVISAIALRQALVLRTFLGI